MREPGSYDRLFDTGRQLIETLRALLRDSGLPGQVVGEPPMFDVVFADGPMRTYQDLQRGNKAMAQRFNAALRTRGILKGEAKHYVSLALTADDVEATGEAYRFALRQMAA